MAPSYLDRVTVDPLVMGGAPCIRGLRVTVGMIIGNLSTGTGIDELLDAYPYLEREDVLAALEYAWLRVQEVDVSLTA